MGLGDLSFAAVASLRSIDNWIATINSNMAGSGRVGYKATQVKFVGGAVTTERPISSPRLGISVAEQSLSIAQTSINYSQGAVTASTDFTHLAIQRTTAAPGMFVLNSEEDGSGDFFFTFDGEFFLNTQGQLVNSDGLYVMSDRDGNGVVDGVIGDDPADIVNDQIALNRLAVYVEPTPQLLLRFSRFGATIFERVEDAPNDPLDANKVAAIDAIGNYNAAGQGSGRVIPFALESSNASLTAAVPELALAQKMYSAISKVIQVAFANIDTALQLGPR
ncbi:MAG: hypothetical protein IGS03_05635 [Candidatus Sericytochromatia bacterium]|nr:hypothetical protein [Candidatus Sericytochromatia bacterium]